MGFIIHYLVLIVNPMGRIMVRWKSFRNNLEILCHHICNWLYFFLALSRVLLSCPLLCPLKLKILGDTGVDNEKNFNTRGKTILGDTGENSLLSFFLALVSFSRVPQNCFPLPCSLNVLFAVLSKIQRSSLVSLGFRVQDTDTQNIHQQGYILDNTKCSSLVSLRSILFARLRALSGSSPMWGGWASEALYLPETSVLFARFFLSCSLVCPSPVSPSLLERFIKMLQCQTLYMSSHMSFFFQIYVQAC